MSQPAVLYFLCGKMGAGKTTLAGSLALANAAILLSEDTLLRELYPNEIVDIGAYVSYSGRLKRALSDTICWLLRDGVSVVLDFPGNTLGQRTWFRELLVASQVDHELHFVDAPDHLCKSQLKERNLNESGDPLQDEATFEALAAYFVPPTLEEGFTVVRHVRAV